MSHDSPSDPEITPEHSRSRLAGRQTLTRVTFRATDDQLAAIDSLVDADIYRNRSEVIRAGIQRVIEQYSQANGNQ